MTANSTISCEGILPRYENSPDCQLRSGPALSESTQLAVRRRAILEGCKWDPQVGDANTLAPFPMIMPHKVWDELARLAELLAEEVVKAEEEIIERPDLIASLGLPWTLQKALTENGALTPAAGRVIRFDFHLTRQGWRISEANSDVPGGFAEASYFTQLMAEQYPKLIPAGDPAATWSCALTSKTDPGGMIGLLSASGFMEDHQVNAFLAAQLRRCGYRTHLARPQQVLWINGYAYLDTPWYQGRLATIIRFYQAEWLARLPEAVGWKHFFRRGLTRTSNPAIAVISESKRFPLVWDRLSTRLPTWRALLPETCEARVVPWACDDDWLLKTAMCNNGDTVCAREWMPSGTWARIRWQARLSPGNWVAQKRFESIPVPTPAGRRHVCVGVYTINGKAAGAYLRLAAKPVIDFSAVDAALLLEENE